MVTVRAAQRHAALFPRAAMLATGLAAFVAGCGTTHQRAMDAPPGYAVMFCVSRETLICSRECDSGRYTAAMCTSLCGSDAAIRRRCEGFAWFVGCEPSAARLAACLDALEDPRRVGTPSADIAECPSDAVCGGGP